MDEKSPCRTSDVPKFLENVRTPSKITSSGVRSRVLCWRPVGGSDLNVVAKFAKLFG